MRQNDLEHINGNGADGRSGQSGSNGQDGSGKKLKVGDLARRTGKSVRALHLYEELGLLTPAARSHGGFRLFDESAVTRIRWIELLQESGFTLHQIQALLRAWQGTHYGPDAMRVVRDTFQKRLAETTAAIERFQSLRRELEGSLEYLNTCEQCRPPRTTRDDCPQCPVDHGVQEPPALVAGFHLSARPGISFPLRAEDSR